MRESDLKVLVRREQIGFERIQLVIVKYRPPGRFGDRIFGLRLAPRLCHFPGGGHGRGYPLVIRANRASAER
jgi:hypothetical protein